MPMKLNQVVAIREGARTRYFNELKELDKNIQRREPFEGLRREYAPFEDKPEERLPAEHKYVTSRVEDLLRDFRPRLIEHLDVEATQEWGNCGAKADVVVHGQTLIKDVPITFLLTLEKKLTELRSVIATLPTLAQDEQWGYEENQRLYVGRELQKVRTQKRPQVLVKYNATPEHPAQTEVFQQDVPVGTWTEQKLSGAISLPRKQELMNRVETLLKAVKEAREAANDVKVEEVRVGEALYDFLFRA